MKRLCSFSISWISFIVQGDQSTELYSRRGLTYTKKARNRRQTSHDSKDRSIKLARLWALTTMSLTLLYCKSYCLQCFDAVAWMTGWLISRMVYFYRQVQLGVRLDGKIGKLIKKCALACVCVVVHCITLSLSCIISGWSILHTAFKDFFLIILAFGPFCYRDFWQDPQESRLVEMLQHVLAQVLSLLII